MYSLLVMYEDCMWSPTLSKLFILYINGTWSVKDIAVCVVCRWHKYFLVQEMNCFCRKHHKWNDQNDGLMKISYPLIWTKLNSCFFNPKKDEKVSVSIDGVYIERVFEFIFLGVIMDDKLTCKSHFKTKVSKNISVLNRKKFVLNYREIRIMYCLLILATVWKCGATPTWAT